MIVIEAVTMFNQLARLCPLLVPTEEERVRRMMQMFKPELAMVVDSSNHPPITIPDYVERTLRDSEKTASCTGCSGNESYILI